MTLKDLSAFSYNKKHLLGIEGMAFDEAVFLLNQARGFIDFNRKAVKRRDVLTGRSVINLFFEASTRTQSSFEIAAKRLGADVMNMAIESSSVKKGETLVDTAITLNAMAPDVLIVRHHASGAAALLARKVDCPVINAGDGAHEHPTQALLDALTIQEMKARSGDLSGLKVVICGDILHSRVARSNILLLNLLGADVHIVAPYTLLPQSVECLGVTVHTDLMDALPHSDVVMMLRIQNERMSGARIPSKREYHHFFGLDDKKLSLAKPDALVMHPGPMNRGVEISSSVADGVQSVIKLQVEMGVAVRMALIEHLVTRHLRLVAEEGDVL